MVIFHTDQYCKSWDFKESGAEDLSILDFVIRYIPYSCCQTLQHWIFDGANNVPFAFASYQVSIVISIIMKYTRGRQCRGTESDHQLVQA